MSLQETVYTMMEKDSCDPDLAPHLESYVNQQTSDNLYDFEANLALLKLYQFYPEKLNEESVSKILAKVRRVRERERRGFGEREGGREREIHITVGAHLENHEHSE
jgi:hypothetical protein